MQENSKLTRRRCLKLMGALGLSACSAELVVRPAFGLMSSNYETFSKTLPMMNTLVNITVYEKSREKALMAQEKAFAKMKGLLPVFNRFDSDSHLSWLNREGKLKDVPPELLEVLKTAKKLYQLSDRRFDLTILPLLEWNEKCWQKDDRSPNYKELQELSSIIGFEHVEVKNNLVAYQRQGMKMTLDGIAKGYLVDQAAECLRDQGVEYGLINAGGDIRTIGGKGSRPWHIGIKDPLGRKEHLQTINLKNLAVATSGSYENHWDPYMKHHHLMNKDNLTSSFRNLSTSVISQTAMKADGLSTALFVLPPRKALTLVESHPQDEACLIARGYRLFQSSGWKKYILT